MTEAQYRLRERKAVLQWRLMWEEKMFQHYASLEMDKELLAEAAKRCVDGIYEDIDKAMMDAIEKILRK